MALRGEGFFALMNTNGEAVYTRDGQHYINAEGVMVNSMGHEFSDAGGNNIQTIPGGGDLIIDKSGQIFQGEQNIGQIGVFVFNDPLMDLQKVGGGFIAKEEGQNLNLLTLSSLLLCKDTWRTVMYLRLRK